MKKSLNLNRVEPGKHQVLDECRGEVERLAFTIGDSEVYEALFADETATRVIKLGRSEDYEGGIAFQSYEVAIDYACGIGAPFKVYGLLLPSSWSESTYLHTDGRHHLRTSARLVRLPWRTPAARHHQERLLQAPAEDRDILEQTHAACVRALLSLRELPA